MPDFRPYYYRRNDYSASTFLAGFAAGLFAGALAMFIFDPDQGRRRRALARDKMSQYGNDVGDYVSGAVKQVQGAVRKEQNPVATSGGI